MMYALIRTMVKPNDNIKTTFLAIADNKAILESNLEKTVAEMGSKLPIKEKTPDKIVIKFTDTCVTYSITKCETRPIFGDNTIYAHILESHNVTIPMIARERSMAIDARAHVDDVSTAVGLLVCLTNKVSDKLHVRADRLAELTAALISNVEVETYDKDDENDDK